MKRWIMLTLNLTLVLMIVLILVFSFNMEITNAIDDDMSALLEGINVDVAHLNGLIESYDNSTLSIERMEIIREYVEYYESIKYRFREFDSLDLSDDPKNKMIQDDVEMFENRIMMNIHGFKDDLDGMSDSISVAATQKGKDMHTEISQVLSAYG